jgi:hypothetical protein
MKLISSQAKEVEVKHTSSLLGLNHPQVQRDFLELSSEVPISKGQVG